MSAAKPLLALSVRQPWAWAIVSPILTKDIENRTWRTRHRGPTLIHASAGLRKDDLAEFTKWVEARPELQARLEAAGGLDLDALRQRSGGIVGRVNITDCVHHHASPWFAGPCGLVLAEAEELPFLPCKGQLGLFQPNRPAPTPAAAAAVRDLFDLAPEAA